MKIRTISITPLEQKFKTVWIDDKEVQKFDCLVPICDNFKHRQVYEGETLEDIMEQVAKEFECFSVDLNFDFLEPNTMEQYKLIKKLK